MGDLVARQGRFMGWEYSETMTAGTESDAIVIPPLDHDQSVSVSFISAGGQGKVQFTTSRDSLVESGTAVWQDWPLGLLTDTASDSLSGPVSGLRLVRSSGTVGIEIIV